MYNSVRIATLDMIILGVRTKCTAHFHANAPLVCVFYNGTLAQIIYSKHTHTRWLYLIRKQQQQHNTRSLDELQKVQITASKIKHTCVR